MKPLAAAVVLTACAGLCACASNSKTSASASAGKPVNKVCPMMLEHDVPEKNTATVAYKGQTVGFCCADCIDGWEKMSDAKRDKMLAEAIAAK